LPANDLRQDYLRASLVVADDGSRSVAAAAKQDSSMQRIMRNAQCLIIRKPFAPAAKAGDMVEILLLESSS
jgi:molybdopterin molybdotransferase